MKKNTLKSNAGFSLVELMVVVAIIGILATLAVPNVNKFMAKSRQAEARSNLSSVYTAEKAFYTEYTIYDSRFGAIGYAPEGNLRYNIGFQAAGVQATAANGYTATPTMTGFNAVDATVCNTAASGGTVRCRMMLGATAAEPPAIAAAICPASPAGAPAGCLTAAATFQAGAASRLLGSATQDDRWAIDHAKNVRNTLDGIQ